MSDTIITSVGLNEVNRSFPSAPLFGIKYFVPVYDYRIDSDVHTGMTSAISYSSTLSATSAQSAPTGEIIWNSNVKNTYVLSQKYIIASGTSSDFGGNKTVTGYKQSSVGVGMNLSGGSPVTTAFTGTTLYPPSIAQDYWTFAPAASYATVNGVGYVSAANMRDKMWLTTDYYPVDDGDGHVQGAFKCNLNNSIGTYKFNKIALYITRYKADGTEDTSELPKFFAEGYVNDVSVKSDSLNDGFSNIVADVRLDFNNYGVISNSGFYANSANDWTLTTSGIYYPQRVGIGSFNNSLSAPTAQIHVRPTTIDTKAIRIDSNTIGDTNYSTLNVNAYNDLVISASTSGSLSATNIKIINLSASNIVRASTVSATNMLSQSVVVTGNVTVSNLVDTNHLTCYDMTAEDITASSITTTSIKASSIVESYNISAANKLYVNSISGSGNNIVFGDNIEPDSNYNRSIGGISKYWQNSYIAAMYGSSVSVGIMSTEQIWSTTQTGTAAYSFTKATGIITGLTFDASAKYATISNTACAATSLVFLTIINPTTDSEACIAWIHTINNGNFELKYMGNNGSATIQFLIINTF